MARTFRNLPGWALSVLNHGDNDWLDAAKLRRDGGNRTYILGSAKNGKLDTWDDVGKGKSARASKRIANKQIRRWNAEETRRALAAEIAEDMREEEEKKALQAYKRDLKIRLEMAEYDLNLARYEYEYARNHYYRLLAQMEEIKQKERGE